MPNSVKEEITNDNIFVKLVLSKEDICQNNDALLIGSPKIEISNKTRNIWNKLAPLHFKACPCDSPVKGFYLQTSWDIPETKFNSLREAKVGLKEHIDAIEYLPFLFLSACGVSVHPQVEFFLKHTYSGVHEWLMNFCLGAEIPKPIVNFDGSIEISQEDKVVGKTVKLSDGSTSFLTTRDIEFFLDKSQSQDSITRYVAKHSVVTNKPIFLLVNQDKEYLSDALLAESIAKRFKPYYELILELWVKNPEPFQLTQGMSIGELIFCCWIEFLYQQIIDLGIFTNRLNRKTEVSNGLRNASKMFLEPTRGQIVVKEPTDVGFLQAINLSAIYAARQDTSLSKRQRNGRNSAIYKAGQAFRNQGRQAQEPESNHPFVHGGRVIVQKVKNRGLLRIVKDLTTHSMVREPMPFQKLQK
jgi:hypothetical protein